MTPLWLHARNLQRVIDFPDGEAKAVSCQEFLNLSEADSIPQRVFSNESSGIPNRIDELPSQPGATCLVPKRRFANI